MSNLVIDNFASTSAQAILVQLTDPGPKSVVDDGGAGVLGTYRCVTLWFLSGQSGVVNYSLSSGECSFNFPPSKTEAKLNILWDANGAGLDLDLSPYKKLYVQVSSVDQPGAPITLTIHSQGQAYYQQLSVTGATTLSFPLSNFSPALSQSALQNVSAIEMSIDGQTNLDLALTGFAAK